MSSRSRTAWRSACANTRGLRVMLLSVALLSSGCGVRSAAEDVSETNRLPAPWRELLSVPDGEMDIAAAAVAVAEGLGEDVDTPVLRRTLSDTAERIRRAAADARTADEIAEAVNSVFFGEIKYIGTRDRDPRFFLLHHVVAGREGSCLGLALAWMHCAREAGLTVRAVVVPGHVFVRLHADGETRNVDLLRRGEEISDDEYAERYGVSDAAREKGVFLADLADAELAALMLVNRAHARLVARDAAAAVADCDLALRLDPDSHAAVLTRGTASVALGETDAARADFERCLRLNPGDDAAERNLRLLEQRMERRSAASEER